MCRVQDTFLELIAKEAKDGGVGRGLLLRVGLDLLLQIRDIVHNVPTQNFREAGFKRWKAELSPMSPQD